jgi:putative PIN family toxin of toxin-antitoxin system
MIRVVLDTNIIVSALLSPFGFPAQTFLRVLQDSDFQLCMSGGIFAEYDEVLHRPHLARTDADIAAALAVIRSRALWVRPSQVVRVCPDPDDDMFLECAASAHADYLVTGNIRHFPRAWAGTKIVTPHQFIEATTV